MKLCNLTSLLKRRQLCFKLNALYVAIDAVGLWGSASAAATKVFQQAFSDLDADGLCGPATKAKLFSLYG